MSPSHFQMYSAESEIKFSWRGQITDIHAVPFVENNIHEILSFEVNYDSTAAPEEAHPRQTVWRPPANGFL